MLVLTHNTLQSHLIFMLNYLESNESSLATRFRYGARLCSLLPFAYILFEQISD